jgi:hypothetical protein
MPNWLKTVLLATIAGVCVEFFSMASEEWLNQQFSLGTDKSAALLMLLVVGPATVFFAALTLNYLVRTLAERQPQLNDSALLSILNSPGLSIPREGGWKQFATRLGMLVIALVALSGLQWTADVIFKLVGGEKPSSQFLFAVGAFGAVVAIILAWPSKQRFGALLPRLDQGRPASAEAMTLFLSNPIPPRANPASAIVLERSNDWSVLKAALAQIDGLDISSVQFLTEAPKIFGRHNWLPALLSICRQVILAREHGTRLEAIFLISSADRVVGPVVGNRVLGPDSGSYHMACDFDELFKKLWPPNVTNRPVIQWIPVGSSAETFHGFQFDNAIELVLGMQRATQSIRSLSPGRIIHDVTGGTKICSIIGAIYALPPGRIFKILNTNNLAEQFAFDIEYAPPVEMVIGAEFTDRLPVLKPLSLE